MKQEEKQLLLKDLCARLPYNLWVCYEDKNYLITGYGHGRVSLLPSIFSSATGPCPLVEEIKPYLRPMSSMTEEEEDEFLRVIPSSMAYGRDHLGNLILYHNEEYDGDYYFTAFMEIEDWLNAHYFDYRKLISKGLALEAPENMYEKK